jgi:hypothetical protein
MSKVMQYEPDIEEILSVSLITHYVYKLLLLSTL